MRTGRASGRTEQRRRPQQIGKQRARDRNEGAVRLGNNQHLQATRRCARKARLQQTRTGACGRQLIEILWIVEEGHVGRLRGIKRRNVADSAGRAAHRRAAPRR